MRAPTALLLALVLVAGCAAPEPAADADGTSAPTFEPSTVAPSQAPGESSVKETIRLDDEVLTEFELTGCLNPRMLFVLDPADAQALLPAGFTAADVALLTQFAGVEGPLPVGTGRAVGGYDFLSCAHDTLSNGSAAFSQVGILVNPPDLGERTPVDPTTFDLYLLALHVDQSAWQELALRSGFNLVEAPLAEINSQATDVAAGQHQGIGSVLTPAPLAEARYGLPSAGRELDFRARYWHVGTNGTFYLEFHLTEEVRAGAIATCTHGEGSAFAKVSGTTTCSAQPRFAAVGLDTSIEGGAYWLPGLFPVA